MDEKKVKSLSLCDKTADDLALCETIPLGDISLNKIHFFRQKPNIMLPLRLMRIGNNFHFPSDYKHLIFPISNFTANVLKKNVQVKTTGDHEGLLVLINNTIMVYEPSLYYEKIVLTRTFIPSKVSRF